jgi:hypothetical protein
VLAVSHCDEGNKKYGLLLTRFLSVG